MKYEQIIEQLKNIAEGGYHSLTISTFESGKVWFCCTVETTEGHYVSCNMRETPQKLLRDIDQKRKDELFEKAKREIAELQRLKEKYEGEAA